MNNSLLFHLLSINFLSSFLLSYLIFWPFSVCENEVTLRLFSPPWQPEKQEGILWPTFLCFQHNSGLWNCSVESKPPTQCLSTYDKMYQFIFEIQRPIHSKAHLFTHSLTHVFLNSTHTYKTQTYLHWAYLTFHIYFVACYALGKRLQSQFFFSAIICAHYQEAEAANKPMLPPQSYFSVVLLIMVSSKFWYALLMDFDAAVLTVSCVPAL